MNVKIEMMAYLFGWKIEAVISIDKKWFVDNLMQGYNNALKAKIFENEL